MKILHVSKKYPDAVGGDAFVVANLEKQQILIGNEVSILTSNCKEIKNRKNVYKFGLLDSSSSLDAITARRILSLVMLFFIAFGFLRKHKPDIIHTHSIDMAFFISFAARFYKIPIFHTFHVITFNDPQQYFVRRLTELFFLKGANPKKIFVLDPKIISDLNKQGFKNVQFIPNGVIIDEWKQKVNRKKNSKFTFISVGRLEKQKGFKYLIEAANILKKEKNVFKIQIIGEGSQFELLSKIIENKMLNTTVMLLGKKNHEELRNLYRQADVFILPSLWEGFPLTILEAWASNLPIIVSKVGAIDAICSNERNALVVKPADPIGLAHAMSKLQNNNSIAQFISKNGYDEIGLKYNWENINKKIMKYYEE
jgi:glycosyltransferase involved in cell wall biosynthesis